MTHKDPEPIQLLKKYIKITKLIFGCERQPSHCSQYRFCCLTTADVDRKCATQACIILHIP